MADQTTDETCIDPRIGGRCTAVDPSALLEPTDRVIAELAERQHGVVARRQLLDVGIGSRAIDVRLGRGSLHRIHLGVYAVGHSVLERRGRWMAAVLACGPGAVLSHISAARCWGLLSGTGLPEVTRPGCFRGRPGIVARFSTVPADERTLLDEIPVTSVSRTILDLASVASRWQVRRALHAAEVQQLTGRLSVPDLLCRYPRRQGSRLLRELLDEGTTAGWTENDFEDRFAELIERHGLPRPRFNADLAVGGRIFRPDCLWSEQRLILELDGKGVHATRRAFEADRERDRLLLADEWRVMRVTWAQLRDDADAVMSDLKQVLDITKRASSPV